MGIGLVSKIFLTNFLGFSYVSKYRNSLLYILVSVIVAASLIDLSLVKIYSFTTNKWVSNMKVIFFLVVGTAYGIGQHLLLHFVHSIRKKKTIIKEAPSLNLIHKLVNIVQYTLCAILVIITLQMLLTSRYHFIMISAATAISYGLAIVILVLLAQRFFKWYNSKREIIVLLYGLSSLMIGINAAFTISLVQLIILDLPAYVSPHPTLPYAPFIAPGSVIEILNYLFIASAVASFILSWSATVLLLRYHSQRFGRAKYWTALSLPLAYFLIQFMPLFPNLFSLFPQSTSIFFLYTLFFTFSRPAGGILFGFAFWMIARRLSHDNVVRDYMAISGMGLMLLFVSNQAIAFVDEPYPPFGLASILFMGLSSYLVLIGIYYSALSASQDVQLRRSIRDIATQLIASITTAQIQQDIENRVSGITKRIQNTMLEETGIPSSLDDNDIKKYTQLVIDEIRDKKEDERYK